MATSGKAPPHVSTILHPWTEAFTCHAASRETRDTARGRGMPSPYGRPLLFSMERISGWHGYKLHSTDGGPAGRAPRCGQQGVPAALGT